VDRSCACVVTPCNTDAVAQIVAGRPRNGGHVRHVQQPRGFEPRLQLCTGANTWFTGEEGKKGEIKVGQLADLAVLSDDFFSVAEDAIQDITSVLTLLGGHADGGLILA
jgi:predicted amidohydrolase YtcJ